MMKKELFYKLIAKLYCICYKKALAQIYLHNSNFDDFALEGNTGIMNLPHSGKKLNLH